MVPLAVRSQPLKIPIGARRSPVLTCVTYRASSYIVSRLCTCLLLKCSAGLLPSVGRVYFQSVARHTSKCIMRLNLMCINLEIEKEKTTKRKGETNPTSPLHGDPCRRQIPSYHPLSPPPPSQSPVASTEQIGGAGPSLLRWLLAHRLRSSRQLVLRGRL